jgi:histidine decarboxylase
VITASSFCGLNGVIWGYHLAKADQLVKGNVEPIKILKRHDNHEVPLLPVEPLLNATERLFGIAEQRRFPPSPGSMVVCATKNRIIEGPTKIWCAIALAIAENREKDANLFVEDAGDTKHFGREPLDNLKENIGEAILLCGKNQDVKYEKIFFGVKELVVPAGYVGCALACAPYITLAKNAIPKGCVAADLLNREFCSINTLPPDF